jgi:hypothetical protein
MGQNWFYDQMEAAMRFDEDSIAYIRFDMPEKMYLELGTVGMSNAEGQLQFFTNGNVMATWDGHIMQGGKGFNQGSDGDDFNLAGVGDTIANSMYYSNTYQIIPDAYEGAVYYMLHSFIDQVGDCTQFYAPKMQISKIDMSANGGKGKVVYKNRYFDEEMMGAAFSVVRHGNGRDWWLVRRSTNGLYFRSILLHRDSMVLTVESNIPGLSADWYECSDFLNSASTLLEVSPDGSILLDNYGVGHVKLMAFDRCSGEVSLIDTFSTGIVQLEINGGQLVDCAVNGFAFSPSGRYLYGVGWAEYAQWDLWASDIPSSKESLGGVPWGMDDLQNVLESYPGGFGTFSLGPDGKLYNLWRTMHTVIEYPDEPGEASGYCVAADNPPSCLGPDVPYYLFSTPHPHYRLGPLTGSACDTIPTSVHEPSANGGYGLTASPTVASGPVEVTITLPAYGNHVSAELLVVDMLGRVLHRHRFPPYAYLHRFDVSGWPAGLYNIVLVDKGRVRAGARLVVAR